MTKMTKSKAGQCFRAPWRVEAIRRVDVRESANEEPPAEESESPGRAVRTRSTDLVASRTIRGYLRRRRSGRPHRDGLGRSRVRAARRRVAGDPPRTRSPA